MLTYSNLQETADELSRRTGRTWTEKEVLDFAWHVGIPLAAATPSDSVAVVYNLRDEAGGVCFKKKFRMPPGHEPLVHLFPHQVAHLIIRGEVMAEHVHGRLGQLEEQITLFDPEIRVTPGEVRFSQEALTAVLRSWEESQVQPEPLVSRVGADGVMRQFSIRHRWPAWVFDKGRPSNQLAVTDGAGPRSPGEQVIEQSQVGSLAHPSSEAKKKKRVRYSPETVKRLHDDYIKSNNGSNHGATVHVAAHCGKSESWVRKQIRDAKEVDEENDRIRDAAGPFGQLLSGSKK